ncbi:glycerophosphodiester phosphodiesterase family protein [Siccirubricoccus deserti]
MALPAEQLELDVHLSADGVPMVIHDATLDRTSDAQGPVRARERTRCGRCGCAAPVASLPTLAEAAALTHAAGRMLRLEIKADAAGRPTPRWCRAALLCWTPRRCAPAPC